MMLNEINKAVECLRQGGIILYPTDTIWGIGCDAANSQAIKRIYEIKNRPVEKSMLILVSDTKMIGRYFKELPDVLFDLEENTDKPLTYVLDQPINVDKSLLHSDGTLGVRIPRHDFCRQLIHKFGKAIVSTSANYSGEPSPIFFRDIHPDMVKAVDYCVEPSLEKGATGKPSSIIKIKTNGEFSFIRK